MCFGGNSAPAAPVETPAVPVDQISAGSPTITVAPNPANNPAPVQTRPGTQVNQQASDPSGVSM